MKSSRAFPCIPVELLYEIFYHLSATADNDLEGCGAIVNAGFVDRTWLYVAYRYLSNKDTQYISQLLNWTSPVREYRYRSSTIRLLRTIHQLGYAKSIDIPDFTLDFHTVLNHGKEAAADIQSVLKLFNVQRLRIMFDADFGKSRGRIKHFLDCLGTTPHPDIVHFAAYCPQRRCQCCCAKGYDLEIADFVRSLNVTKLVLQQMQPGTATLAALRSTREITLDRCADSSFISHFIQQLPYVRSVRLYQDDLTALSSKFLTRLSSNIQCVKDVRIRVLNNENEQGRDNAHSILAKIRQQIPNLDTNESATQLDLYRFLQETGFSIKGNELILSPKSASCPA
ncbi:hypothetical protein Unana1_05811 [Umbelopsis nana]